MVVTRKVRGKKADEEPTAASIKIEEESVAIAILPDENNPPEIESSEIADIAIDDEPPVEVEVGIPEKKVAAGRGRPKKGVSAAGISGSGGRKYQADWEEIFSWVERAPDQSENAFCILCRDVLEPRFNGLSRHENTAKHKGRERGDVGVATTNEGAAKASMKILAGGRRYRTAWEMEFAWVRRAPGDNLSQNAYCTVCHEILLPKYNSLLKHQATAKHAANSSAGSGLVKLGASPLVASAKFREQWREKYPWVSPDPQGNPGLAYCTVCAKALPAKSYMLAIHMKKAKHLKRSGMTVEEADAILKSKSGMLPGGDGLDSPLGGGTPRKRMYERRYRTAWEQEFPFIQQSPDGSEYAYCKLCRDTIAPKVNDIRKHMFTMKHRKRAIASGFNTRTETVTLVAGAGAPADQSGLRVVQVPGSTDFTVVPVDSHGQVTTTEVVQVVEAAPPENSIVVALPGEGMEGETGQGVVADTTIVTTESAGAQYHRNMLQEGLRDCLRTELHTDVVVVAGSSEGAGEAVAHQLVLAAASPLLRQVLMNLDPAAKAADEMITIMLPDFTIGDVQTLLPWLYGGGSDESQPVSDLIKVLAIGQPQTFVKESEMLDIKGQIIQQQQQQHQQQQPSMQHQIFDVVAPMQDRKLVDFSPKTWPDDTSSSEDDDENSRPVHMLPRGRGRRRRYVHTENGWECVECGLAMAKREYMRGHYEECIGGGKVMANVPKDIVIVGSEKGPKKNKNNKRRADDDEMIGDEGDEEENTSGKKRRGEDVLKCGGCKTVFKALVELRAHLASHDKCNSNTFVCDECPKTYGAERSLRIHILQVHQTELICDKCAKNFGNDHKKFLRHIQRAHLSEDRKDRTHKCTECSRSFDYEKNLERHLAKHKDGTLNDNDDKQQKEFICDQCGKIYANYKSWFYHVKSHSVIYQCQQCPRGFKTPRGLKYHMALHTGIAAFHCGECGKAFITRDKLILHQRSRHSAERPHACEWCGKGFLLAHKLAEHRRRVHTGEKPFKCNMCDQRFTDSSSLSHHRKRHAGVITTTPRVITQQTIVQTPMVEQAVVVTGADDDDVDSEEEAANAAAALTGRLSRPTHLLTDGGIVFEVHNE